MVGFWTLAYGGLMYIFLESFDKILLDLVSCMDDEGHKVVGEVDTMKTLKTLNCETL